MNLDALVKQALPHLKGPILDSLKKTLHELESEYRIKEVEKQTARTLLKSIDGVMAAVCRRLNPDDARTFMDVYTSQLKIELLQLTIAIQQYAPRALNVEFAKKDFGENSVEVKKARAERQVFIKNLRDEIHDLMIAALADDTDD
jgi:hypothetical protein